MVGANAADTVKTITATLSYDITVKYNGETQELKDAAGNQVYPISYNGTTYLPVRAVADMLGIAVNWDGPTQTVWLGAGFTPTPVAEVQQPSSNKLPDLGGIYLDNSQVKPQSQYNGKVKGDAKDAANGTATAEQMEEAYAAFAERAATGNWGN